MSPSRRSFLAAAGVSLASLEIASTKGAVTFAQMNSDIGRADLDKEVSELIQRSAESNSALMRGDINRYLELIALTEDFTLMSPFGGDPTRGSQLTNERMQAMGRFFRNGTLEQEVVQAYGSADMVVLAIIERAHVEVGSLPAQRWSLRVTLVYRREGSGWLLAHRHADPLVESISLEQAAALARGEEQERRCA